MASGAAHPLITLLTDFGTADTYVGVMKAVILGICPQARIIDLSHDVAPQDVQEAAYLLDTAWPYCPPGTVHVVVVDPGVGTPRRILCVEALGQRFVAPDNGVLSYVLDRAGGLRVFAVERRELFLPHVSQTFHGRDIMAPVAAHLARGLGAEAVGPPLSGAPAQISLSRAVATDAGLEAHVIHIDHFGNLITDLGEEAFAAWSKRAGAQGVLIRVGDRSIQDIRPTYAAAAPGELVALFGSTGRLEISVNGGSAAELLGARRGAMVVVGPRR
jgi:hypothetical protein